MEARLIRVASTAVILSAAILTAVMLSAAMGASYRTPNFVVETPSPTLAEEFGQAAETFRHQLAISWLGEPMPRWAQPCMMTVRVGQNLGAGGATTFVFNGGEVYGWRMTIQGSQQRILDSVLPHEITHMVFASHFRRPLPRWADEGGATSVEQAGELAHHRKMLVEFLHSRRGIAFNRMFSMTDYPRDVMPLYAQGFSLCEYLIRQGGQRKFVAYMADGLKGNQWAQATRRHYGYDGLGALQNAWVGWVAEGFPQLPQPDDRPQSSPPMPTQLAAGRRPRPQPNLIHHVDGAGRPRDHSDLAVVAATAVGQVESRHAAAIAGTALASGKTASPEVLQASAWQAVDHGLRGRVETRPPGGSLPQTPTPGAVRTQVAHPQPVEQSRQIILEWRRE